MRSSAEESNKNGTLIGANYHPHDWGRERWRTDVELMKQAGFTTVRLGHWCWDSFEPEEGVYTFESYKGNPFSADGKGWHRYIDR